MSSKILIVTSPKVTIKIKRKAEKLYIVHNFIKTPEEYKIEYIINIKTSPVVGDSKFSYDK